MTDKKEPQVAKESSWPPHLRTLVILATLSACLYGLISLLSWRFDFDRPTTERPILGVLGLFAAATVGYLYAIRLAARAPQDKRLLTLIIWSAILFRSVLLPSVPIQEIDIYRYLWDGAVSTVGVSPFRSSPHQVRTAAADAVEDPQLAKLVRLRNEQPSLAEVLRRVHFGELPTIYPPTSQTVFAAAAWTTPRSASVLARVFVMKAWLVGFDVATLLVIIALLRVCRLPVGLCVVYAWCPLLLKEVANSGHLVAVAVFLTTLAVYIATRAVVRERSEPYSAFGATAQATLTALLLGLAVGAKLYPVVLAPLICVVLGKSLGWRRLIAPSAAFAATTLALLWPMLPDEATSAELSNASDPSLGLATFLRRWEMNDFIFLVIVENLKPVSGLPPSQVAWFSIIPESVREDLVADFSALSGAPAVEAPFLLTRAITASVFVALAGWFAWRAARTDDVRAFCEYGFLTLAWFWLLCPTQNPWYWTWALPLLPFARNRAWLAVSGLVLLYYMRFWLTCHWPDTPVLGSAYVGHVFFDFVVTWVEFAPWFVWLAVSAAAPRRNAAGLKTGAAISSRKRRLQTAASHTTA